MNIDCSQDLRFAVVTEHLWKGRWETFSASSVHAHWCDACEARAHRAKEWDDAYMWLAERGGRAVKRGHRVRIYRVTVSMDLHPRDRRRPVP